METTHPKKEAKKSETDAHRTQNLQVQFEDCFPKLEEAEDSQVGGLWDSGQITWKLHQEGLRPISAVPSEGSGCQEDPAHLGPENVVLAGASQELSVV